MIRGFRHGGLKRLYLRGDASGVGSHLLRKVRNVLTLMDVARVPRDLDLPGFRLHQLKGDREGQWAVAVSGNWRIVFTMLGGHVFDVDLIDYH
jgi:proteic killer suppression protein